ncbi:MAG TPA: IclR family transcriptional regulator C-terminal domain-containing protein [Alphaproteobacteria bacterium]|nr:IclR family transcriptional regulator C-terminal domain-containing protein [Alphaproteobacteria bacterium]
MAHAIEQRRKRGRPRLVDVPHPAGGPIQTIDRALGVLRILAGAEGLALTDLAQRAGLAPSTAHRLLASLGAHRFVFHDEERSLWFIGVGAFEVGTAFLRSRRLAGIGRVTMHALMESTGETVNLGIEDNGEIVFISQVESHGALRAFFRAGTRAAMHASGVGKALLAQYPKPRVREILHKRGLPRFTARTIVEPEALFHVLAETHERGWAVDDEERTLGMRCLAAPIFNEHGEAIAGISLSGPAVRLTPERVHEFGPLVRRSAEEITASIGGRAPAARAL